MCFGPIWDFDYSMTSVWTGQPYNASYIECASSTLFLPKMSSVFSTYIGVEANYEKVQERWDLAYFGMTNKTTGINAVLRAYKEHIDGAARYDAAKWYGETGEFQFDMQYDYVRLFLQDRLEYLNDVLHLNHDDFMLLLA